MGRSNSRKQKRRWLRRAALAALLVAPLAGAKAWHDTMRDPVIKRTSVQLPGLQASARPLTVALISDIHVAGPDMPPERLEQIVLEINALKPDAVLIAGDLVSEKGLGTHVYSPREIAAPLGKLDSPLGTFVAPGNHDHWFDMAGLASELRRNGITVLANQAEQVGPLVIGGLDDDYTGHADLKATLEAMDGLSGGRILLSHSPDPFPEVRGGKLLLLAGHTHCGQIRFPVVGAIFTASRHGNRYACGRKDENGSTVIVGAGLGTSLMPVRFGTTPEVWLIELHPGT